MVYKLLAINIDGTLLQSNGRISKNVKEAIDYAHSKRVAIALVTSRNYQSSKKIAKALKINPMIVAAQGAYVGMEIGHPLLVRKLSSETTADLIKVIEGLECQIQLNYENAEVRNRVRIPENLISKAVMYVSEQTMYAQTYVDNISDYIKESGAQPLSIEVSLESQKERQELIAIIHNMFDDINVIEKGNRLIIIPENVSKWKGIRYLADYLKISAREIVAIGDSDDDYSMIDGAGIGVAMGNSSERVKKAADWNTRSNDDDGVAYLIKELFRKQHQLQSSGKMK